MSKIRVLVVEEVGDKNIYVILRKDEEVIPNSLYRLQHPGMMNVENWNSSSVSRDGENVKVDSTFRIKKFFSDCVKPVEVPQGDIEEELVQKYGANTGGKINPNTLAPKYHAAWNKVIPRFLDGSLWEDIPDREGDREVN
jgi:hypothetical protein